MTLSRLLALAVLFCLVTGCNSAQSAQAQSPRQFLAPDLELALAHEYGRDVTLGSWADMMTELQTANVVCIGEAHYDPRDMATAFEIVQQLAARRKVALAVERFSYDLQPQLDALMEMPGKDRRNAAMDEIIGSPAYRTVWGSSSWSMSGFPVNTPSRPIFEAMVHWAVEDGIPLIGLDVTLVERERGLGEDLSYRNALWKNQIDKFRAHHPQETYLVIVVGGVNHMDSASGSFPTQERLAHPHDKIISIGQRDAMYQYKSPLRVAKLANLYALDDLIINKPQFAVVSSDGSAVFPQPPDYWIAVHAPAPLY